MSKEIKNVQKVESDTEIEVKESVPTPSGKELLKDKINTETMTDGETLLEQARKVHEELKKTLSENKQTIDENRQILDKIQRIRAEEILHGRSEAGQISQVKVESPQEYAQRIMRGGK